MDRKYIKKIKDVKIFFIINCKMLFIQNSLEYWYFRKNSITLH